MNTATPAVSGQPQRVRGLEQMMAESPAVQTFVEKLPAPVLEGLCCPECGQGSCFVIEVCERLLMFADGAVLHEDRGEFWDDDSYCRCPACQHTGEVINFRKDFQAFLAEYGAGG